MKDHILESQTMDWLVRSATEALVIVDAGGHIVLANAAAASMFGYRVDALSALEISAVLPDWATPDADTGASRPPPGPESSGRLKHAPTGVREAPARRADGSGFPVEICVSPLTTYWGLALWMVSIRDITPRKQAEQALRDSEARLRTVFDTAVDAVIIIDERGNIERFNTAAVRLFGYQLEEVLGRNVSMLMPAPHRKMHDGYLEHYLRTGEKKIIGVGREVVGMRKDGTVFPMDLAVAEMHVAGRRMFTGVVRDITERKRAEAMFRTLVEQVQAITYVREVDGEGALRYISPQVSTLGYTVEECLSAPSALFAAIHALDRDKAAAAIGRSRKEGMPLRVEYRITGKDGRERWFREEAEIVRDPAGQPLFQQGILIDITQNKLAEEALRDSRETLRRLAAHQENIKEDERKRIAQEIHDELGSLLTGIKAYVSVSVERATQAGAPPDPLLQEAARLTEDAIQAVRRVINDLRPSVLDQLGLWEAIQWYAGQVEARSGLACDCSIDSSALQIQLDPERTIMLFRIVQESLTNVVRHADASMVSVHAAAKDGVITVEIRDDGKGFAAEQPSNRHSWGIQGMQERTRHFGGQLTVSSVTGKGTRVALRLPLETGKGYR
jgi:two-component system sensor histidine kinase UhpB